MMIINYEMYKSTSMNVDNKNLMSLCRLFKVRTMTTFVMVLCESITDSNEHIILVGADEYC